MAFLESHMAPVPRVGPKHPDYQRWLTYFKRQSVEPGKGAKQ